MASPIRYLNRHSSHASALLYSFLLGLTICHHSPLRAAGLPFLENGNPLLRGSDSGYLLDTPTRIKIDLSGPWSYQIEGGSSGSVRVPSAYDFTGKVEFQRSFSLTAQQVDAYQFQLVGLGVNYSCDSYVNGEFVGNHVGGFTSFMQFLPRNFLQDGNDNTIRLLVSNQLDPRHTLPLRASASSVREYGGVIQDMFILGTPQVFIRDAVVRAELSENAMLARVTVRGIVDGPDMNPPVHTETAEARRVWTPGFYFEVVDKVTGLPLAKSPVVPLKRQNEGWEPVDAVTILQGPKLWSPDTPDLYLIKCHLVQSNGRDVAEVDEYDVTYGVRKLAIEKGHLLLNGSRLAVKGVDWHEQSALHGSSMTYEEREKDVVLMKNLGANLIRFVDHPPHPYMLDLCDRYGILAMEQIPLANPPAAVLGDQNYLELAVGRLTEMIDRDRNHPSVLAWGMGDAFEPSPEAKRFVRTLIGTARALDPRPTYYVSASEGDSCSRLADIATANISAGDLRGFKARLQQWHLQHHAQPVIAADLGCEVQPGNHGGTSDPYSVEAQARFYVQRFEILKSEDVDGAIIASFNDWKGQHPSLAVHSGDPWLHTVGLVSMQRDKRLAYDAVRSIFRNERFIALPVGKAGANEPIVYVLIGFVVLIGIAYFYNANRRFRESVKRSLFSSYNFFADIRDQRAVSLLHTTYIGLVVSLGTALVASSMLYHSRGSWILDNSLTCLLVVDRLKASVVSLIWSPFRFVMYCTVLCFAGLLVVSGLLWTLRWLFKTRIYPYHAYSIAVWSTTPVLVFVPAGMVLYRLMEGGIYVIPAYLGVSVFALWVLLRLLKGAAIVLDVYPPKMFALGFCSLVGVATLLYFYYDYTQGVSMYLPILYHALISS